MKILNTDKVTIEEILNEIFLKRSRASDISLLVRNILNDVKERGDEALREYTRRFDSFEAGDFWVSKEEIQEAYAGCDESLIEAVKFAKSSIEKFHKANLSLKDSYIETVEGVEVWREFRPIERVGLYVPGGKAAYPSTLLMLAVPAKLAACKEIVICTPAPYGKCNPVLLAAAYICGVDKILKLGGAQAIAALAYGTESVLKVDKIFGPGNQYVSTAKMLVFGETSIDMPAGPSELMIAADSDANVKWVAADMLSQLEHAGDSQAVLLTDSFEFAAKVKDEMISQSKSLSRADIIADSFEKSFAVVCSDLGQITELVNAYAPEHLEIISRFEEQILASTNNAGSVFLGAYSSEPLGDYVTGANHTLPTSSYARMFAPLSLESFGKKIQVQRVSKEGISNLRNAAETLALAEGLDAHARAVSIRFET